MFRITIPKSWEYKDITYFIGITPCVRIDICKPRTRQVTALLRNSYTLPCILRSEWWGGIGLSIFGELVCGLAFVFGFLTRLALLPMIFTMIVAFTTVFGGSISAGELPFLYLIIFVLSWFAGAGKFSVDGIIRSKISRGNW